MVCTRYQFGRLSAGVLAVAATIVVAVPAAAQTPAPATGSLLIRAVTGQADPPASFTFGVTCTGGLEPLERTVVVTTNAGSGTTTVDGVPMDSACLVIDRAGSPWRIDTSNPQAVVASPEGTPVEFVHSTPAVADMIVTKISDPSGAYAGTTPPPVQRGAQITYLLTYSNQGDVAAQATITDEIPAGTTYAGGVECRPACSRAPVIGGGRIRFSVPVEGGATGSVSYAVRVADDAADGDVIGSRASAEPGGGRSDLAQHRVSLPKAGLRVTGRVDKDSAPVGDVVSYTLDVANHGSARQDGVTVTDAVPPSLEYVDGSATCPAPCLASYDETRATITWKLNALGADMTATGLSFGARIRPLTANPDGSLPGTVIVNSAVASSVVTPATASNEVKTIVVAVLGRKIVRDSPRAAPKVGRAIPVKTAKTRTTKATMAAPTLPATGLTTNNLLGLATALIALGAGLLAAARLDSRLGQR